MKSSPCDCSSRSHIRANVPSAPAAGLGAAARTGQAEHMKHVSQKHGSQTACTDARSKQARRPQRPKEWAREALYGAYPSQSGVYGQVDCKAKLRQAAHISSFQQQSMPGVSYLLRFSGIARAQQCFGSIKVKVEGVCCVLLWLNNYEHLKWFALLQREARHQSQSGQRPPSSLRTGSVLFCWGTAQPYQFKRHFEII